MAHIKTNWPYVQKIIIRVRTNIATKECAQETITLHMSTAKQKVDTN